MNREELKEEMKGYKSEFPEERNFVDQFLSLLEIPNCYERSLLTGHITGSAWVTTRDLNEVLLLHHRKLDKWLQPGGHADGDENIISVAKKELSEEAGLNNILLDKDSIFDLDIHSIPERKGIPQHLHYDIRYHFIAQNPQDIKKNEESNALRWVAISEVPKLVGAENSILRMVTKTKTKVANG